EISSAPGHIDSKVKLANRVLAAAQHLPGAWTSCDVLQPIIVPGAYLNIVEVEADAPDKTVIPFFEVIAIQLYKVITEVAIRVNVRAHQVSPIRPRMNFNGISQPEYSKDRYVDVMQVELSFMIDHTKIRAHFISFG